MLFSAFAKIIKRVLADLLDGRSEAEDPFHVVSICWSQKGSAMIQYIAKEAPRRAEKSKEEYRSLPRRSIEG